MICVSMTGAHCTHWADDEGRCCSCGMAPDTFQVVEDVNDEFYCPSNIGHGHCPCWLEDGSACCACDAPGMDEACETAGVEPA